MRNYYCLPFLPVIEYSSMKRSLSLCCLVALAGAVFARGGTDPRVRTYVNPIRIVWTSPTSEEYHAVHPQVADADILLSPRHGQVPEGMFWDGSGCTLKSVAALPAGLLVDFGQELHGGLEMEFGAASDRGMKLRVRLGESVAEAMSELGERGSQNDHALRDAVIEVPACGSIEFGPSGFRFARIDLVTTGQVRLEAIRAVSLLRPLVRLGSFRCSDQRVNDVWETAVRTLHLCAQTRIWDGIKRDRLVWMGDLYPEVRTLLSVFGTEEGAAVLRETLDYMVATTPPTRGMNMGDPYSMWFVRCFREYWFRSGDDAYLARHAKYLSATCVRLAALVGPDGRLTERLVHPFLDWPTKHNVPATWAGLQGLMCLVMREGSEMLFAAGEGDSARVCETALERLRRYVPSTYGSKQAAALLALSGLANAEDMYRAELGRNGCEGVSTFYGYYMLEAMSLAGENRRGLDTLRDYWGAMLDMGATSFWEDFRICWTNNAFRIDELPVAGKRDIHGDYGEFCYRGFRHSLCHGWAGGPAAWCIDRVLGVSMLEKGGKKVRVRPDLGGLDWAEGTFPVPGGVIKVHAERKADGTPSVSVQAPAGVEIIR